MKRPYTTESWVRFRDLLRNLVKRSIITETKADVIGGNVDALVAEIDQLQDDTEELREDLDNINDLTTGINLLRGTRDFRYGTKKYKDTNYVIDGFMRNGTSGNVSIETGEHGISIVHVTGEEGVGIVSSVIDELRPDDELTVSFEVMFNNITSSTNYTDFSRVNVRDCTNTSDAYTLKGFNFSDLGLSKETVKTGIWYKAVATVKIKNTYKNNFVVVSLRSGWDNGDLHFRMLSVNPCSINHPIYAPSYNDINYINDITTGTNLLRGTRDFREGTERPVNNNAIFTDGFSVVSSNYVTTNKEKSGFTSLTLDASSSSNDVISYVSAFDNIKQGDKYTFFVECKIETEKIPSNVFGCAVYRGASAIQSFIYPTLSTLLKGTIESRKWYLLKYEININVETQEGDFIAIPLRALAGHKITFRKAGMYKDHIEHPEWSPAPADFVLGSINDITTGINLLKGTRDFIIGSIPVPGSTGNRWIDGFYNRSSFTLSKDNEGFTIASKSASGLTSPAYAGIDNCLWKLESGTEITVSFEFMVDDVNKFDLDHILYISGNPINSNTDIFHYNYTPDNFGIKNLESKKWYKVKATRKITYSDYSPEEIYLVIRLQLEQNGSINFRKLMVQKGNINNPEWFASPFDVAQQADLETVSRNTITSLITANTNFQVIEAYLYQATPLVAQLYVVIQSTNAISSGAQSTLGTLNSQLIPIQNAPLVGTEGTFGHVSNSGALFINATRQISAGTKIYLNSVYILKSPYLQS